MLTRKAIALFGVIFLGFSSAQAMMMKGMEFFGEPFVGYGISSNYEDQATTPVEVSANRPMVFGARLGAKSNSLIYGIEAQRTMARECDTECGDSDTGDKTYKSLTGMDLGVFVGYEFPAMFRVWGSAFLLSSLERERITDSTSTAEVDESTSKGYSFKVGAGYTGLPFVNLNVEAIFNRFKEEDSIVADQLGSGTTILASVSMPFPKMMMR